MIGDAGSPTDAKCRASYGSCRLAARNIAALALGAWLVTAGAGWAPGCRAVAAAVDAANAPSPTGFADIIERVKPAVVGVRVKVEGAISSDDTQQQLPFPPGSPLDRFFRQFGVPIPDSLLRGRKPRWPRDSSSLETATS
jgi:serine protease Do